ncbi:hypothetical protein WDW37_06920 [Bdellovibrionota bacterium FG-1]
MSQAQFETQEQVKAARPMNVELEMEKAANTEDLLMTGAKTMAGIGIGFVIVTLGATGVGALLEATIIPTTLAKVAGAIAGGGIGLSKGISDNRKEKTRRRRSVHFGQC